MKKDVNLLEIAGESNTGLLRRSNEDHYLICHPCCGKMSLAVVSDGVGGHSDGEIASMICCRELFEAAVNRLTLNEDPAQFLQRELAAVNRKLFERNYHEGRARPMGCTAVAALFSRKMITVANVGDSRFYEFLPGREKALQQISRDHRPDEELLEKLAELYQKDKEELRPRILLNSLGTHYSANVDVFCVKPHPQARYMLCSDGLSGQTPEAVIARIMGGRGERIRDFTSALMREALIYGARDNVTVICARYNNLEMIQ